MAGIKASLYKDIKLFRKSAGILTLILPFILSGLMFLTMSATSPLSFIRPFKVAVIDRDHTVMSATIISEARQVPLFESVDERTEEAEELIKEGYTAVFTIPEDFFYDAYTFRQEPVKVLFNQDNSLQSSIFRAVFTSIMGIMKTEQAVSGTILSYAEDSLSFSAKQEIYEKSSERLISAALSRNTIYDTKEAVSDFAGALARKIAAVSMIFLLLLEAFSVLKTIPQEIRLGISSRMKSIGAGSCSLLISKILFYLILTVPALLIFGFLIGIFPSADSVQMIEYLLLCGVMLVSSFLSALAAAHFSNTAAGIRQTGSVLLLLSLFFSGTLLPFSSLSGILSFIRYILPAGSMYSSLEAIHLGVSLPVFLEMILPVLWYCAGMLLLSLVPLPSGIHITAKAGKEPASAKKEAGLPVRFLRISGIKFYASVGKLSGILLLIPVLLLCSSAAYQSTLKTDTVRIAVVDKAGSPETSRAKEEIAAAEGISVITCDEAEAYSLLASFEAEGMLVINQSCAEYLRNERLKQKDLVSYISASSSFSAEAVREIAAGTIASERLRNEAYDRLYEITGEELSDTEKEEFIRSVRENEALMPDLFDLQYVNGEPAAEPFSPPYESYPVMAVLFLCMSAASWCGSRDNRHAGKRLLSLPGGRILSTGADFCAVVLCGMMPLICFGILRPLNIPAAILGLLNISAFSLLSAMRSEAEGKIDAVSPYIAFMICLLGGCFADLSPAFPLLKIVSMISPAGLFLQMSSGVMPAYIITIMQTILFLWLLG